MASEGKAGYLHQAVPLKPRVSSSTFLHSPQTVLLLFLFDLSTTYLLITVAPGSLDVSHSTDTMWPLGSQLAFLYHPGLHAQGWHCPPNRLGPPTSIIKQENALRACLRAT